MKLEQQLLEEKRAMIFKNARVWRERIGEASAKWGGCEICAVTKTQPAEVINLAWEAGLHTIGENRVQELMDKREALCPGFSIHLIGTLQTNKVKYIAPFADMVQSLDRDALAQELSRRALAAGRVQDALIQVNIAREPQKGGVPEEELAAFARRCAQLPGIRLRGLMAIMPLTDEPDSLRPYFRAMRGWFERLRDENIANTALDTLSMGMSGDCIVAAQEGATMVRLGRALFGERPGKQIQGV